ncbi:transposable element Tcb2 transposase [Trichonephila clavipes]|nr:transposable element Tcb2 transposase [Trichonephila clavipes]
MVRKARVQPSASSVAIQEHVAPSLGALVSSRTIRMHLAEDIWDREAHYVFLTPIHRRLRLEWCHAQGNWTAAGKIHVVFSDESRFNPDFPTKKCS